MGYRPSLGDALERQGKACCNRDDYKAGRKCAAQTSIWMLDGEDPEIIPGLFERYYTMPILCDSEVFSLRSCEEGLPALAIKPKSKRS